MPPFNKQKESKKYKPLPVEKTGNGLFFCIAGRSGRSPDAVAQNGVEILAGEAERHRGLGGGVDVERDGARHQHIVMAALHGRIAAFMENPGSDDPLDQVELTP
ncbi:hypothetical protein EEL34_00895 [Muribaculaceae bacterium Isolate-039 (Harlan)]|nr:hypothetical protein EEL34_00895 [Muribaculaceae bacterium Isolate-039 (Harlan)]